MPRRGIDRSAVRAYARDISHLSQCVEVIDADVPGRARPGNIKVAPVRVCRNVVESAIASDQLNFEYFVRAAVLCEGETRERKHDGEYCYDKRFARHCGVSIWRRGLIAGSSPKSSIHTAT